jgi:hypothetical protein
METSSPAALFSPRLDALVPGTPIRVLGTDRLPADRIQISPGTIPAAREHYVADATIPVSNWRPALEDELSILERGAPFLERDSSEFVAVLKVPEALSENFAFIASAVKKHNKQSVVTNLFNHPKYRWSLTLLHRYLHSAGAGDKLRLLGHFSRPGGRSMGEHSTSVGDEGKYVGLHVDSWNTGTVSARESGYPTRFCMNLGPEARYFQFINLPFRQIAQLADYPTSDNPNTFAQDFLCRHRRYPVTKLRVEPGEAYVAPTEIIIHDGSTIGKNYFDASVTFLGAFTPEAIDRIADASIVK